MILLILAFTMFFAMGCSDLSSMPLVIPLEDSIKEIIISKGPSYNFLDDRLYISKVENFIDFLNENTGLSKENFLLANLSDDNIPEIIVFEEKKHSDKEDTGYISVYGFDGNNYILLDRVSMNYDVSNYMIKAGYVAPDTKGFYVNNRVGNNCGITYGFILEEGRLINIFDEKKINLVSSLPENPIHDVDKNGILNFSIVLDNPEVARDEEKILIWYEWDGVNGGRKVKVQYYDSKGLIIDKPLTFKEVDELEKALYNPDNLIFRELLNSYSQNISMEYRDYLIIKRDYILNRDSYKSIDKNIYLNLNSLSDHIIDIEKYLFKYPYSTNIDELMDYLNFYKSKLLVNPDNYKDDEFKLILLQMEDIKNKYNNFYLSSILDLYIEQFKTKDLSNDKLSDIRQ